MIAKDNKYAVETLSLTKVFTDWWGRSKIIAVDNLNLQVKYNEIFGLLGPNGSGKTTTIKVLLSLLHPTKGKAFALGGDTRDPKITARIGFMPEESYLYKYLTARETLDFYGRLFALNSKIRKTRIDALLEMTGLKAVANRPVGTYSKGMARRIGLAQALINDPDLLILDEPTTGLDPIGTRQIKDLLLQLAKRGKTVLLCSHLLADVEDVCDRIAILYGGRMQTQGKVNELLQQSDKRQILTNRLSDRAVEKIKQIAESENARCQVTSPMDKLESFFIKIVEKAQQQAQPTGGAVSTTQIGEFLTSQTPSQALLDKLVEASTPMQHEPDKPVATEPVKSVETAPDDKLLEQLTQTPATPKTEPVQPTQIPQPDTQPAQDILDELTDPDSRQRRKGEQDSTSEKGDGKNA